jgi:hypothetical protein
MFYSAVPLLIEILSIIGFSFSEVKDSDAAADNAQRNSVL